MSEVNETLKNVPQFFETAKEHDARMQWFRDAKFGMFIHWGPCSVGEREIGWGRNAHRPYDIRVKPPSDEPFEEEYDNYYKQFNPVKFNGDEWLTFAKEMGVKYMVLITKHHDGFSMFDTKLSDYDIMATPYGKDIVREFVEACHRHGIRAGLYYSTRDWYHQDYLVGDNQKYDEWYRGQVEELLTNYGKVDIMWYDHVGGQNWGKWRFDKLFSMMYRCQPELLVNNRAARFCGPKLPGDQGPATPELAKVCEGDYYTPEGKIGVLDIARDWESCIHVGQGWSYRGEDGFKEPDECIKILVACVTGGGNLLLNLGPRPDGTFADGEVKAAKALGAWLQKYGEAIYGTRGGPYDNGAWGGSCHKGNKLYLHIYKWHDNAMSFDALPVKVLSAKTLDGAAVEFSQSADDLTVKVAPADQQRLVTVLALTLDGELEVGKLVGNAKLVAGDTSEFGVEVKTLNDVAVDPELPFEIMRGFEAKVVAVTAAAGSSLKGLTLHLTCNNEDWQEVAKVEEDAESTLLKLTHFHAGIDVLGQRALDLKLVSPSGAAVKLQEAIVYGS